MRKHWLLLILAVILFIPFAVGLRATTWGPLIDCEETTLQNQIDNASVVAGDTILLPAQTCDWQTRVTVDKCITIQGQGVGSTTIRDADLTEGDAILVFLIPAGCDGTPLNYVARATGISFVRNGGALKNHGVVVFAGSDGSLDRVFRLDHCSFTGLLGFNASFGDAVGVIDHTTYYGDSIFNEISHNNWNGVYFSNASFADPPNLGAAGNGRLVVFEDDTFEHPTAHGGMTDAYLGGRYLVRRSTLINSWIEGHGSDSTPKGRGERTMSADNNLFICTLTCSYAMNYRSGTGVIHDNAFYGWTNPFFNLSAYRLAQAFGPWDAADGYSYADLNDAGTPFLSTTATSGTLGTLTVSGATWNTTANGGLGEWAGYSVRKTNCTNHHGLNQCSSIIQSNTADTMTYELTSYTYNGALQLDFTGGGAFTIGKVTEAIDQPGRGQGTQLAYLNLIQTSGSCTSSGTTATCTCQSVCTGTGLVQAGDKVAIADVEGATYNGTYIIATTPSTTTFTYTTEDSNMATGSYGGVIKLPATNDQIDEPLYGWNNCEDTQNPPRIGCGGGGTYVPIAASHPFQIRANEHFFNNTVKPGYNDLAYPHWLTGASPPSGGKNRIRSFGRR